MRRFVWRPLGAALPLEQREAREAVKLEALRAAVEVGVDDLHAGRVMAVAPGDELSFVLGLGPAGAPGA